MSDRRRRAATVPILAAGCLGFLTGLILLAFSGNLALAHLGLVLMVASPVAAFWRLVKSRLAPHCPRPPAAYE